MASFFAPGVANPVYAPCDGVCAAGRGGVEVANGAKAKGDDAATGANGDGAAAAGAKGDGVEPAAAAKIDRLGVAEEVKGDGAEVGVGAKREGVGAPGPAANGDGVPAGGGLLNAELPNADPDVGGVPGVPAWPGGRPKTDGAPGSCGLAAGVAAGLPNRVNPAGTGGEGAGTGTAAGAGLPKIPTEGGVVLGVVPGDTPELVRDNEGKAGVDAAGIGAAGGGDALLNAPKAEPIALGVVVGGDDAGLRIEKALPPNRLGVGAGCALPLALAPDDVGNGGVGALFVASFVPVNNEGAVSSSFTGAVAGAGKRLGDAAGSGGAGAFFDVSAMPEKSDGNLEGAFSSDFPGAVVALKEPDGALGNAGRTFAPGRSFAAFASPSSSSSWLVEATLASGELRAGRVVGLLTPRLNGTGVGATTGCEAGATTGCSSLGNPGGVVL